MPENEVVASEELEMDALTLADFLTKHVLGNIALTVVYVMDDEGRIFEHVSLERETLSDGSHVFNLVLK